MWIVVFTDLEGDSCFSIYQISWIKLLCKLKTSYSRKFVHNLQTFRGSCQVRFYDLVTNSAKKVIFSLPVNTDKLKSVAFVVFVCTTASFIAQTFVSRVFKRDTILAPVAKQWIAKDIPSYGSQSNRAKIAIHWFGKYYKVVNPLYSESVGFDLS